MLVVDASGSEEFGSVSRFKREIAAELAAVLSFAAITNNDKVGLLIFTDKVELIIPPKKGRRHVLRVIRELLAFRPRSKGTDIKLALETVNQVLKRRSIVFLVSDFISKPELFRRELAVTNRRHDLIAIDLSDPFEGDIDDVGLLTIQDPETGEVVLIDTGDRAWRRTFAERIHQHAIANANAFTKTGVDIIHISTSEDYTVPLTSFFKQRSKRIRH